MLKKRLEKILKSYSDEPTQNFHITNYPFKVDTLDEREKLNEIIEEINPILIIFDPLGRFHLGDENSSKDMLPILEYLNSLKRDDRVVLAIHHQGKKSEGSFQKQSGHRHRGSSVIGDVPDMSISMQRTSEKNVAKLSFECRNIETPDDMTIKLNENLVWEAIDTSPEEKYSITAKDVELALTEIGATSYSKLKEYLCNKYETSPRNAESKIADALKFKYVIKMKSGRETIYNINDRNTQSL